MSPAKQLIAILRNPDAVVMLDWREWTGIITIARAENLLGILAARLAGQVLPGHVAHIMEDARSNGVYQRRGALWEAECARRALSDQIGKVILTKGTAYVAAGLEAGEGRHMGSLEILVEKQDLDQVENALLKNGGWEWVKDDYPDNACSRDHIPGLPPMIHVERGRKMHVRHNILPSTTGPQPDISSMMDEAEQLDDGLYIFAPADMLCHCAAQIFANGDLTGGLQKLWDIHCLLQEFNGDFFWRKLERRAKEYKLSSAVHRAVRLSVRIYGTYVPREWRGRKIGDYFYLAGLLARDEWGRKNRKLLRLAFHARSRWLHMPPIISA